MFSRCTSLARSRGLFFAVTAFSLLCLSCLCGRLSGATLAVTNTNSSGAGSFADALATATSGDTIQFGTGLSGTVIGQYIISVNLTIKGPGQSLTMSRGTATGYTVDVPAGITCTVEDLTLTGGIRVDGTFNAYRSNTTGVSTDAYGRTILIRLGGSVLLNESLISGGGIHNNQGSLLAVDCEFVSCVNSSQGTGTSGGALENRGDVTLRNCTFQNNRANANTAGSSGGWGGAINQTVSWASLLVENCTFDGNVAASSPSFSSGGGGALYVGAGTATLTNCTVASNTCQTGGLGGGGIRQEGTAQVNVRNCIIALNTGPAGPDFQGTATSLGNNLVGDGSGSINLVNGVNNDQVGNAGSPIQPLLALLLNNGGKTRTRALLTGSPAINAGTSSGAPPSDQRGYSRSGQTDIGAFEFGGVPSGGGGGGGGSGGGGSGGGGGCSTSEFKMSYWFLFVGVLIVAVRLRRIRREY